MNLFGFDIEREPPLILLKLDAPEVKQVPENMYGVTTWLSGSWPYWGGSIRESYPGAWQQNVTLDPQTSILAFSAVFACVTGIAGDIGKMRIKLEENNNGIWNEITANQPWLPLLRKPNHFQTRIKFLEQWIVSKLLQGNTYVLKERQDKRGLVTALYVLDPLRVTPLVAENGDVYYRLKRDLLARTDELKNIEDSDDPVVPASEIIHDTMVALWHPLIGISPIYACGMSATMGNRIQQNSTNLFGNGARPGGILTSPSTISDEQAQKLKARWEAGYSGLNVGRVAILGDGLKYEAMAMNGVDAQLIEQLKWTVEDVARAFHYPLFKLGGPLPPYAGNVEALIMSYYTDCLQTLIESLELSLDEGLALPPGMGTELDLENLMRMDTAALYDSNNKAVGGGWMAPNEARFRANFIPVAGGESPYLQQQNYSLEALAKRDAKEDPFAGLPTAPTPPALPPARNLSTADLEFFESEMQGELVLQ